MRRWIIGLVGVSCAGFWLALLVASGFNLVAVSAGLLTMLYLTGRPD